MADHDPSRESASSLLGLALAASGFLAGCSRDGVSHGQIEPAGSIGLNLTAAPGITLNSVTYSITGSTFSRTGAIDTGGSPNISGTIGGIPAGKGYTITLTATSVGGQHDLHGIGDVRRGRGGNGIGVGPSEW